MSEGDPRSFEQLLVPVFIANCCNSGSFGRGILFKIVKILSVRRLLPSQCRKNAGDCRRAKKSLSLMFSVRGNLVTAITGRAGIWGSSRRLEELLSAATEGGETAEPEHKFRERSKHVLLMKPGGKAFP